MNFPYAITVVIPCPLVLAVTDRPVRSLDLIVALPFIGVTNGLWLNVVMHMLVQRLAVGMLAHAQAALPTLPANRANHRWPVIFIGAVTAPLVGSTTRRIKRIAVLFAFFPPHSETSRQSPCRSVPFDSAWQKHWSECACANDARRGGRAPVPEQARWRVRLCRFHVITRPSVADQGCYRRREFPYKDCRPADKVGSDNRPIRVCECETPEPVQWLPGSPDIASRLGESISSSIQGFLVRPTNRLWGRSFPNSNMHQ